MNFIIEGIDGVGKDTLIKNIICKNGFHNVLHYQKPIKSELYDSLQEYQYASFLNGFSILERCNNMIFNRFHLGEVVYSPMYRQYSGDYVYDLEKKYRTSLNNNTTLLLLVAKNTNRLRNDGLSHNYNNRGLEQNKFIDAFNLSNIKNKKIIYVNDENGEWNSQMDIWYQIFGDEIKNG